MDKFIKKICFIGNFEVDYSSESHYLKTLEKLGYEVMPLQENQTTITNIDRLFSDQNCDMLFWVHTHNWSIPSGDVKSMTMEDLLRKLKVSGIPAVGYHLDLWKGLEREKDLETDPYWNIEYFFTCDKLFVDDLKAKGIKAYFLPAGVFEDECYIGDIKEEFKHDVIFVGSRGYHSEWPYRGQLIEWLEKTYGSRFAQYGGGGKGTIRGKDLNNLYASSKIVIGDTLCKNFDYPFYSSDRLWETIGRGGFLIYPKIYGLGKHFTDKKEVIYYPYNDFEYLKYAIDYFLEHDQEREKIRIAGFERCKREGTYTQRLEFILDVIENEI